MTVLLTGVYTAQAFLTMEHMDSTRHYMNIIEPYRKGGVKNPSLQTVLFIVEGLTYLKAELNYSLALEAFREGCKWAEAGNDPNNHIVLLAGQKRASVRRGGFQHIPQPGCGGLPKMPGPSAHGADAVAVGTDARGGIIHP